MSRPDEAEIDAIHEAAREAAKQSRAGAKRQNPYPVGTERADIWDFAFRQQWNKDNH